jgi:hypothetical protein
MCVRLESTDTVVCATFTCAVCDVCAVCAACAACAACVLRVVSAPSMVVLVCLQAALLVVVFKYLSFVAL